MHHRILQGLRNGEFDVVYQPQFVADGSRVASVEALVRWNAPDAAPLPLFLEAAEKSGAIVDIGQFVLRRGCEDATRWPGVRLAVNVSALQLRNVDFVTSTVAIVRASGLPFANVELELVESALLEDVERAQAMIMQLRELGFTIALHDFGTGFSSLTYLCNLSLDKLKIDKSFVAGVGTVQSAAIVQSVVALARALGLKVTAEGVETADQHSFLRACGCHFMQGYLFSKPVAASQITAMLQDADRRKIA